MCTALPSHLLSFVFEFLDKSDFIALLSTCQRFSRIILNQNKLWARECLSTFLSFDLELHNELYESESYKSTTQAKVLQLTKQSWKQLLAESEICKRSFATTLAEFISADEARSFVDYFYETLKYPNLPIVNLKRETVACPTQTLFQTKLSEVLYEDTFPKNLTFCDQNRFLIDKLQQIEQKLLSEMRSYEKNEVLQARWYNFDKKETCSDWNDETISLEDRTDMFIETLGTDQTKISNTSTEDLMLIRSRNALLINIYNNLVASLSRYCELVHAVLSSLDDVCLIISEYTSRWKVYVCSMLELEKTFTTFTDLFNTHYETIFEGYPCFPKFSIWRLMTKIWIKEVFEKSSLNICLNESFLILFNNHREINTKHIFSSNISKGIMNEEEATCNELPKGLFVDFHTKEAQQSSGCQDDLVFSASVGLGISSEVERNLLQSYIQSIQDLSFNEVDIHYLQCTDIPINYPYNELEEVILNQSSLFYREYENLFKESPEYFCRFLQSDSDAVGQILGDRTCAKLAQIQDQAGVKTIKRFIGNQAAKMSPEMIQKYKAQQVFQNENESEIQQYAENLIQQALQEKHSHASQSLKEEEEDRYNSANRMEEELENEQQMKFNQDVIKAVLFALGDAPQNVGLALGYLWQRSQCSQSILQKGKCIRQTNMDKNIPCELTETDSLFYSLSKDVNVELLEKIYEEFLQFKRQQESEQMSDILAYTHPPDDFGQGNPRNGLGFEQNFLEEEDNFDFLSLEEPTLRRALF